MIENAPDTYSALGLTLQRRIAKLRKLSVSSHEKLKKIQNFRLWTVGVFLVALGIGTSQPQWRLEVIVVPIFVILFPIQVKITRNRRRFWQSIQSLIEFFERQCVRVQGVPYVRGAANVGQSVSPKAGRKNIHVGQPDQDIENETGLGLNLIRDLGVFGPHSLFSLIDETFTTHGKRELLSWMSPQPPSLESIEARQRQIQSLRREAWFFTRLTLIADQARSESQDLERLKTDELSEFIKLPFLPAAFHRNLAIVLIAWLGMATMFVLWFFGHGTSPLLLMVIFAGANFWAIGETGPTFKKGVGLDLHLSVLEPIFSKIERRTSSQEGQATSKVRELFVATHREGPAREARKLSLIMIVLGVETNPLLALILNLFLPWGMVGNYFLERQRRRLEKSLPLCLDELAHFEALGSLLILDRYQTRTYPTLAVGGPNSVQLRATGLFHPLIKRRDVVANDFAFETGRRCGLLTGSNMAGKSTFLRTIGLNQI